MKILLLSLLISLQTFAEPLKEMKQRLKVYDESAPHCAPFEQGASNEGLFVDVSCEFKCAKNPNLKIERSRGTFIPREHGLTPGNGSGKKIVWGSVGVAMKLWSEQICMEKSLNGCQDASEVESSSVHEIESGSWKIMQFPGCSEKGITVSPFDNSAGSNLMKTNPMGVSFTEHLYSDMESSVSDNFEVNSQKFSLSIPAGKLSPEKCEKIITADLCFGDCIDMNRKGDEVLKETLATAEPLGKSTIRICGDSLFQALSKKKVSASVREDLCEMFFWKSFLKSEELGLKSCAATRGTVHCKGF